jgi:CubicO group peptidase (beta-lactamase class C family)
MARGRLDTEAPPGAVPGLSSSYADEVFREASWGFGWSVLSDWKGVSSGLGLSSRRAYCHSGHGLAFAWVDPQYELVGAYLPAEDTSRLLRQYPWEIRRNSGAFLFADAVTPAIVDR